MRNTFSWRVAPDNQTFKKKRAANGYVVLCEVIICQSTETFSPRRLTDFNWGTNQYTLLIIFPEIDFFNFFLKKMFDLVTILSDLH